MDELYVAARRVLLDVLAALQEHRRGIVLVGAQAIYLRAGEADLAVTPFTSDADLVLDPRLIQREPALEALLQGAGFRPKDREVVGTWLGRAALPGNDEVWIPVDLLVPRAVSPGKGRRSARLPGHEATAARIAYGLEATLVDNDVLPISSLDAEDPRCFDCAVAGPAGLLVAKLHKIQDRTGTTRSSDKDALDILRILRGVGLADLVARWLPLYEAEVAAETTRASLRILRDLFTDPRFEGASMAARAAMGRVDAEEVRSSCALLATDLLEALGE